MRQEDKLTDVHTHLDQYAADEMEQVLRRADEASVRWILTVGMDLQSSANTVEIAATHERVLASVGVHPWVAAENFPYDFREKLSSLAGEDVTVAIGEVGLDFVDNVATGVTYHDNEDLRNAQEQAFQKQVQLACELGLPLNMHCRGANSALISILKQEKAHRVGGVVHNFDGDDKAATQLLDMGFYLSFGGTMTYPTETALREFARHVPLDGLLIETDSPYMPLYGQPEDEANEPANVAQVARTLAELRQIDTEELINRVYTNFRRLRGNPR
ncbi:MAG: TatD family hydrolase [Candidatus Bipolaricaulia bacterium]